MEDCLVHTLNYLILPLSWHYFSFFHVKEHASLYMFTRYFWIIWEFMLKVLTMASQSNSHTLHPMSKKPSMFSFITLFLQSDCFLGIVQLLGFLPPRILKFFVHRLLLVLFFLYFLQDVFSPHMMASLDFQLSLHLRDTFCACLKISPEIINVMSEFYPECRR